MLTQLRFKNWRSLKDVTIDDLQPINVFIGANSSGKTNILDGLQFIRSVVNTDAAQTVFNWGGQQKIRTIGSDNIEAVDIEYTFTLASEVQSITNLISFDFGDRNKLSNFTNRVLVNGEFIFELPLPDVRTIDITQEQKRGALTYQIDAFVNRIQLLNENFLPPANLPSSISESVYIVEPDGKNVVHILSFMQRFHPTLFTSLQDDLRWMLEHVNKIGIERTSVETQLRLEEKVYIDHEAPTVSAGTRRILAMLTAYYALDMRFPDMPGLIVIEEPDTALNPGLLKRFVEQIRNYAEGEHPRQFIFTTHNPSFLDHFKPEEVRVVERDEQGYTTVKRIPEHIRDIWLDEYGLGEVWTTRSFGGVPE